MDLLYTDEHEREVYDVTQDLKDLKLLIIDENKLVKAERKDDNVLILNKREGGHWWIWYWWLVPDSTELNRTKGTELTKFSRKDINPDESLFKQVNLF